MSEKIWSDDAWEDYLYWQSQDKKILNHIENGRIYIAHCRGIMMINKIKKPCDSLLKLLRGFLNYK